MHATIVFHWSDLIGAYRPTSMDDAIGAQEVADWLSSDIQFSLSNVEACVGDFIDIAEGRRKGGYIGTGNAHSVMAVGEDVYLECEFGRRRRVFLKRAQIIHVLEGYRKALTDGVHDISRKPDPIQFEYVAEGDEAEALYVATGGSRGLGPEDLTD